MILVTGATGFVGSALAEDLTRRGREPITVARATGSDATPNRHHVASIDEHTDWTRPLAGVDVVVHCAARVHQMKDRPEELELYRRVNTAGTLRLAETAASAGARRFVFVSTIKVFGDSTAPGEPFSPSSPLHPTDHYGRSKAEAEDGLWQISERTGMQVVVVRPPLVYGRGAKGNIERLVRLLQLRIPLPLGSIRNRRSLVGLQNLSDFLVTVIDDKRAAGKTFVVADRDVVSTPFVLRTLGAAMGRRALLVPVPPAILRTGARIARADGFYRRLASDLEVDSSLCQQLLGWQPPRSTEQSIASVIAS